jgi:hypothetical protein
VLHEEKPSPLSSASCNRARSSRVCWKNTQQNSAAAVDLVLGEGSTGLEIFLSSCWQFIIKCKSGGPSTGASVCKLARSTSSIPWKVIFVFRYFCIRKLINDKVSCFGVKGIHFSPFWRKKTGRRRALRRGTGFFASQQPQRG